MPEVDFRKYRMRRNPFWKKIVRNGIKIQGVWVRRPLARSAPPSKASLEEMPEVDLSKARRMPNRYASIAENGYTIQVGRGRPRKEDQHGPTVTRSIRFPKPVWSRIQKKAEKKDTTVHAALRIAVSEWLERD